MSYEINLIEGERGKLHVTSDDARTKNAAMFGVGRKVFNMDDAFEATLIGSNTVRIASGVFYNNGMFIRIDRDKYVEVNIENGLPGTLRNDLICIRYERNIQTQLESASIVVKKGVASETVAVDPDFTQGDVLDLEEHLDEFPLYRVSLNGLTPTLEPMFIIDDAMDNFSIYESLLDHIQDDTQHGSGIEVDRAISSTSTNPVQNKVVKAELDKKADVNHTHEGMGGSSITVDSALSTTSTNPVQNKVVTTYLNNLSSKEKILELLALAEIRGWKEATVSSTKLLFGGSIGKYVAVIPTSDCADEEYYFLKTNSGAIYYGKMKETTIMNYPRLIHGTDVGIIGGESVNNTIGQRTFNLDTQQGSANMGWGTDGAGGVGIVCSQNKELKAWYIRVSDATISDLKANKSSVLPTVADCTASTKNTDIAGASALAELNDSLKTENSACTEFEEYNTAVNTTWTNNLYYKNQIIDCALVIRLNPLTANTDYNIYVIPSGYQPPAEILKIYTTHLGTRVLVTFRPTNTIIIKPLSDITTNTEILYIHETWVQF